MVSGLERLIREIGVHVETGNAATAIEVENGRAVAVHTEQGEVPADIVLSNADYIHTEMELLPKHARSYSKRYWRRRVLAPTMFIIYLGLSKKLSALVHHNLYFSDPWKAHFEAIFDKPAWPEKPSYYVSCASYDDSRVAPDGKENIFFLVPVAPGLDDNDAVRERFTKQILDHFEELTGERIRDSIEIMRIFSHRDFNSAYNSYQGTALGLAHTLFQTAIFRPAHHSKRVSNLHYTGQYTHPGVGVPMTFISSEIVTNEILRRVG
jgi:phytoene desaturase